MEAQGVSKTQIIFHVNLSHKLAVRYMLFLVKKGLLKIESNPEGTRYFRTERGDHLLRLLSEVEKELSDFYSTSLSTEMKARDPASRTHPSFGTERGRVPVEILRASLS